MPGSGARDSGFYSESIVSLVFDIREKGFRCTKARFAARTALLCLHSSGGAVKWTHRMGTLNSFEMRTHSARVLGSAFVLSVMASAAALLETLYRIEPTHDDGGTGCEKLFGDFDTLLSLLVFSICLSFS